MREKADYRATLEEFNKVYPDKMMLSLKEASELTGHSRQYIKKCFGKYMQTYAKRSYINKCTLARLIS